MCLVRIWTIVFQRCLFCFQFISVPRAETGTNKITLIKIESPALKRKLHVLVCENVVVCFSVYEGEWKSIVRNWWNVRSNGRRYITRQRPYINALSIYYSWHSKHLFSCLQIGTRIYRVLRYPYIHSVMKSFLYKAINTIRVTSDQLIDCLPLVMDTKVHEGFKFDGSVNCVYW